MGAQLQDGGGPFYMVRVQWCGVLVWGAGTKYKHTLFVFLSLIFFFVYVHKQLYLNSHRRLNYQLTETDNTGNMSKVGQVFAERKRAEEEQQTRNIFKINWLEKGNRTGEKEDRNKRNKTGRRPTGETLTTKTKRLNKIG